MWRMVEFKTIENNIYNDWPNRQFTSNKPEYDQTGKKKEPRLLKPSNYIFSTIS